MQPPPRGCVLKQLSLPLLFLEKVQPPPRGCVLKHWGHFSRVIYTNAAASARLCVETRTLSESEKLTKAAASARLCVETTR